MNFSDKRFILSLPINDIINFILNILDYEKKIVCIIDFGQSHLKFLLVTETFIVARTMIFKNNFKISKKNRFFIM